MGDFNVLIRKKQDHGQNIVEEKTNGNHVPKHFLYDRSTESFEEVQYVSPRPIIKTRINPNLGNSEFLNSSLTNKAFLRAKINSETCPVCFEYLNEKIKRVYSKKLEGKVYLPFLDHTQRDGIEKVKLCYPCYKHIVTQWKEYNRSDIPHDERVYWDRNGNFIPSSAEENEMRYNRMIRAKISNISNDVINNDVIHFDDESDIDSKLTLNEEVFYIPRKSQVYQNGLIEYNFDDLLAEINRQLGRIEVSTRINLNKTRKEIEKIVEKHNQQLQNEIAELRNDADFTKAQVNNLQHQINDIYDQRGPLLRRRKKKLPQNDGKPEQRKPFL